MIQRSLFLIFTSFVLCSTALAQNTSPYWSLAGNSNATTASSKLGTTNSVPLRLYTKNAERLRIDTLGRVGIGITSPTSRLQVNTTIGTSPFKVQINNIAKLFMSGDGGLSVGADSVPPANGIFVVGNVGIGVVKPVYKLQVNGDALINKGLNIPSGNLVITNPSSKPGLVATAPMLGISGNASNLAGTGVSGQGNYRGVFGSGQTYGVMGESVEAYGVGVIGKGGTGVKGITDFEGSCGVEGYTSAQNSSGVYGQSDFGPGVYGYSFYGSGIYGSVYDPSAYAGYFAGSVYSTGIYQGSDRNLKKDIADVTSALDVISKLQPKSYTFRQDGAYKMLNQPQGKHYGLIAQDVEQVLPDLVKATTFNTRMASPLKQDSSAIHKEREVPQASETISFKAINYTELIPILIKAVQEQQTQIEELKARIDRQGAGGNINTHVGALGQLIPNPANNHTRVAYHLPKEANKGQLLLTDASGKMIKSVLLANAGYADVNTSSLNSGVYNCTLIIGGKLLDTKKLVIAH